MYNALNCKDWFCGVWSQAEGWCVWCKTSGIFSYAACFNETDRDCSVKLKLADYPKRIPAVCWFLFTKIPRIYKAGFAVRPIRWILPLRIGKWRSRLLCCKIGKENGWITNCDSSIHNLGYQPGLLIISRRYHFQYFLHRKEDYCEWKPNLYFPRRISFSPTSELNCTASGWIRPPAVLLAVGFCDSRSSPGKFSPEFECKMRRLRRGLLSNVIRR